MILMMRQSGVHQDLQRSVVTKYKYLSTVIQYFQVSVLYLCVYFSENFNFYPTTFTPISGKLKEVKIGLAAWADQYVRTKDYSHGRHVLSHDLVSLSDCSISWYKLSLWQLGGLEEWIWVHLVMDVAPS